MSVPARLAPLLAQFDVGRERLVHRLVGPTLDSGDGEPVAVPPLTDDEYLWEPVGGCWSVRRRADGPGPGATVLVGAGAWVRDGGRPHPYPPPVTTIAWRLVHLAEMLEGRADHLTGTHAHTEEAYAIPGTAAEGVAAFQRGADAWRAVLTGADDEPSTPSGAARTPTAATPRTRCSTRCGGSTRSCCTTRPRSRSCGTCTEHAPPGRPGPHARTTTTPAAASSTSVGSAGSTSVMTPATSASGSTVNGDAAPIFSALAST